MSATDKAKQLVNEKFYQPLTIHLNVNNNNRQMWEYAKICALITVEEIINAKPYYFYPGRKVNKVEEHSMVEYWQEVKAEIEKL
jgi:hypothetical protein